MKQVTGRDFIPSYVMTFMVFAVITPYLSIMVRGLGYSPILVGILLGIFEGSAIAGPFLFGYWADKIGNFRFPIIVSCIIPAITAIPLVRFINPVFSALLLAGMAFGFRSTTSLLDSITTVRIGKSGDYGKIRVCGSLGFIAFLLFLQYIPFQKPDSSKNIALWIVVTSIVVTIYLFFLPRSLFDSIEHEHDKINGDEKRISLLSVFFIGGFAIIFLCRFAMSSVYTYFPLYLTEVLNWDAVGIMFALSSASEIPIMFFSVKLLRRFGALSLLAVSAGGIALRLLLWAIFPYKPIIIAGQLLHSLCFGVYHPAAVQFISSVFPAKQRGIGMPVYLALGSGLPSLLGNIAGGVIVEGLGYRSLFAIYAGTAVIAILIFCFIRKK